MTFTGFPEAALDFYDDLEIDNTRSFWEANKHVYEKSIRAPMIALTDDLAEEFGPAKIFRPHRDVRFSKDKSPIKTSQGAYVRAAEDTGWYVAISARGVYVGGGFYSGAPAQTALMRRGIDDERRGTQLQKIATGLSKAGFDLGGDIVKTVPRGFTADHPRIELLRHKSLTFGTDYGFGDVLRSRALLDRVRKDWRRLRPLVDWFEGEFG